jgi:photosystem II stability/assembly factor-like uncharacterized protein
VTTCFAGGGDENDQGQIIETTNGGASWSTLSLPYGVAETEYNFDIYDIAGIDCLDVNTCFATVGLGSGAVLVTRDGGATWSLNVFPNSWYISGISCPDDQTCFIAGDGPNDAGSIYATTNGGTTWVDESASLPHQGGNYDTLSSISCPTDLDCFATGDQNMVATTDGGQTWTFQSIPEPTGQIYAVTCTGSSSCFAASTTDSSVSILNTVDGGSQWEQQEAFSQPNDYLGISCPTSAVCVSVGPTYWANTQDGGATWSSGPLPVGTSGSSTVSCPSVTVCIASTGTGVVSTMNGGSTWSPDTLPPNVWPNQGGYVEGISCPSDQTCFAAHLADSLFVTNDGGSTWASTSLTGGGQISTLACPSALTCYASGGANNDPYSIYATTNGGETWTTQTGALQQVNHIACPSESTCFASNPGNGVERTTDGGNSWSALSLPSGSNDIEGLSCPTTSVCYAASVNAQVYITNDGGTTWTAQAMPGGATAIACPSTTTCFASNYDDQSAAMAMVAESSDGGATWSQQPVPSGTASLDAISCPALGTCFSSGQTVYGGALVLDQQDASTLCSPGSYSPSGDIPCTLALPGTYVGTSGATAATACPEGYYSSEYGEVTCTAAPAGTYVNTSGAQAPTDCALGSYSPSSGATSCTPAPLDTYVDTEGASAPIPCPTGTQTLATGSTSAADCRTIPPTPTVSAVTPSDGRLTAGTSVTITGTNFVKGATVLFGTAKATSVAVVNANTITAKSPAGTGTVNVIVTTAQGASATTPADVFTYLGVPTVIGVSPAMGPQRGGTSVTLTGKNFYGPATVYFGGVKVTVVTVVNSSTILVTSPAGTGTQNVRVVTSSGESATSTADRFQYFAPPTVTKVAPATGPAKGGTTVTISGAGFVAPAEVSFGGVPATGVVVYSGNRIVAVSPAEAAGAANIAVTTPYGTSATSAAAKFTYQG